MKRAVFYIPESPFVSYIEVAGVYAAVGFSGEISAAVARHRACGRLSSAEYGDIVVKISDAHIFA